MGSAFASGRSTLGSAGIGSIGHGEVSGSFSQKSPPCLCYPNLAMQTRYNCWLESELKRLEPLKICKFKLKFILKLVEFLHLFFISKTFKRPFWNEFWCWFIKAVLETPSGGHWQNTLAVPKSIRSVKLVRFKLIFRGGKKSVPLSGWTQICAAGPACRQWGHGYKDLEEAKLNSTCTTSCCCRGR